ncbi:MAG: hypothetical protein PHD76_09840 [Methylacidiphilales bacterium]|nr:hypothetical protein [Candidatus Methylacidiphilales bacterium]
MRIAFGEWFDCIEDYRTTQSPPAPSDFILDERLQKFVTNGVTLRDMAESSRMVVNEQFEEFIANRIDIRKMTDRQLLCGHFDLPRMYLHQRCPEIICNPAYRVVTFVRDPLQLVISLFKYCTSVGVFSNNAKIEDYLFCRENVLASYFPCTEKNYRKIVDRYFFVGLSEKIQEGFDCLATILDKPGIDISKYGVLNESRYGNKIDIPMQTLARFKEKNALDYRIYDYCKERFEAMRDMGLT